MSYYEFVPHNLLKYHDYHIIERFIYVKRIKKILVKKKYGTCYGHLLIAYGNLSKKGIITKIYDHKLLL